VRAPDFSDEEHAAVVAELRKLIADDKFPLSPRLKPLKSALAKLDPQQPCKPKSPPKPPIAGASEAAIRRHRLTDNTRDVREILTIARAQLRV
jgi:hypothetical protein